MDISCLEVASRDCSTHFQRYFWKGGLTPVQGCRALYMFNGFCILNFYFPSNVCRVCFSSSAVCRNGKHVASVQQISIQQRRCYSSSLPEHYKIALPALSPTMEMGRYQLLKSASILNPWSWVVKVINMVLLMCWGPWCIDQSQSVSSLTAGSIQPTVMSQSFIIQ